MNEQIPLVDPNIFKEEMALEFSIALTTTVDTFVKASEIVEKYSRNSGNVSPETTIGDVLGGTLSRFMEETGSEMTLKMGDVTVTAIGDSSDEPVTVSLQEIAEDQYFKALVDKEESSSQLIEYVAGLHTHISTQLEGLFEEEDIPEKSWEFAWKKTREIVRSMGGGYLADVADFFDGLVELQYPETFDPMKRTRGNEASNDISSRTFYVVMEPHLKRATMRKGEDNWS